MKAVLCTLIIGIVCLVSCKHSSKRIQIIIPLQPEIERLVNEIAKDNVLKGSAIGYAGEKPLQWVRYEQLSTQATNAELRALTNHKNSAVKCYAFMGLSGRKNVDVFPILVKHLKDTERVSTFFGCIKSSQTVGDFFLNGSISESDSSSKKLTVRQKAIIDSVLNK